MNQTKEFRMMNRNPYDTSIEWLQPQSPANKQGSAYMTPQQGLTQPHPEAKPQKGTAAKPPRMPKQRALEVVHSLKKGIVISSIMSFGVLGLLATGHAVGTTASNTKTTTPVTTSSSSSSTSQPNASNSNSANNSSSSTSQSNNGGFFNQGNGSSFGSNSSQGSVSGTSVS